MRFLRQRDIRKVIPVRRRHCAKQRRRPQARLVASCRTRHRKASLDRRLVDEFGNPVQCRTQVLTCNWRLIGIIDSSLSQTIAATTAFVNRISHLRRRQLQSAPKSPLSWMILFGSIS